MYARKDATNIVIIMVFQEWVFILLLFCSYLASLLIDSPPNALSTLSHLFGSEPLSMTACLKTQV